MNTTVKEFQALVKRMCKATDKGITVNPLFNNIKFHNGTVEAGNRYRTLIEKHDECDLSCLVDGVLLEKVASKLPAGDVSLTLHDGHLVIVCGNRQVKLPVDSVDSYPEVFRGLVLPRDYAPFGGSIHSALKHFLNFTYKGDARPVLQCIHFDGDTLIATDGIIAAMMQVPFDIGHFTLHRDVLRLVCSLGFDAYNEEDGVITFRVGDSYVVTREATGKYPDIRGLFDTLEMYSMWDSKHISEMLSAVVALETKDTPALVKVVFDDLGSITYDNLKQSFHETFVTSHPVPAKVTCTINARNLLTCLWAGNEIYLDEKQGVLGCGTTTEDVVIRAIVSCDN